MAYLPFNVVRVSVDSLCPPESLVWGQLELREHHSSSCRGLRSAAGLHDDERGGVVDREPGHHGGRIVDDDYGQDERVEAALFCRVGSDADAEMVEADGWESVEWQWWIHLRQGHRQYLARHLVCLLLEYSTVRRRWCV